MINNFNKFIPRTSQSRRKAAVKIQDLIDSATLLQTKKIQRPDPRLFYTSHRNRMNSKSNHNNENKSQNKFLH